MELLRENPDILLGIAILATVLMVVAIACISLANRITYHALFEVKERQPDLYKQILRDRKCSWVERGAFSPGDCGIAWRLKRKLHNGGEIVEAVDGSTRRRFIIYSRIATLTYVTAMVLVISAVAIGFVLAWG